MREMLMTTAALIEAISGPAERPGRYRIRAIQAGLSDNGNYYSDAVLREAAPLFEGARVFVKSDAAHSAGQSRDFRDLIGRLSEAAFVAGQAPDSGEIRAVLTLIEPAGAVAHKFKQALAAGMADTFGFSIDAVGAARPSTRQGKAVREATKISAVRSVDLIVEPAAGGALLNLIETRQAAMDDVVLSEATVNRSIDGAKLSAAAKKALKKKHAGKDVTEAQLNESIVMYEAVATELTESGRVTGLGDFDRIEGTGDRSTRADRMLDAFFDPESKDHRHAGSFKEVYRTLTGDRNVTGNPANCDEALMRESLGASSWANVLGNSITRRLLADYRRDDQYSMWRQVASVVRVDDFRSNERTRVGGYGDLPIVAEGAAYIAQTSPTDEKATYSVAKRGGTEDITLEMIRNDDVGALQRVPTNLSRAAKRTLSKFVFDFIRTNPTIYDAIAFFHASHNNLLVAALDATQLAAHRLLMLKQTELSAADRIGIAPKSLLVSLDLEETAVNLFNRNTNNDKTFLQTMSMTILPVWYWTDTNDWATVADPMDIPTIEIGFLGGSEEPELFVQDNPTVGSMFSNDKLTYKIRHIYGGAVTDFRGATKAVVP